ncbi:hypothetical protein SASPL_155627 [Salvia splendens]|uniref:Uncharacterized protein n=1 Tax=Salvia splendens TaxID=180675 RepID=A0A8X8VY62_SALSN|nr:hypothetical protein SASPL_155627 [Salvia splendens]
MYSINVPDDDRIPTIGNLNTPPEGSKLHEDEANVALRWQNSGMLSNISLAPKNATLAGIVTCINASIATVKTYPLVPDARGSDTALLSVPEMCYLKIAMPENSCVFDPSGGFVKLPIVVGLRSGLGMVTYFIPGAPSYSRP